MPRARTLDPTDYPTAAVWLNKHGYVGIPPIDAYGFLDSRAWRSLKAYVRSARLHANRSKEDDLDRLLETVQNVAGALQVRSGGMTKAQATEALLAAVSEIRR